MKKSNNFSIESFSKQEPDVFVNIYECACDKERPDERSRVW